MNGSYEPVIFFIFYSLRADNTSIVTVMLDPPGPPRAQVLRRLHGIPALPPPIAEGNRPPALPPKPSSTPNPVTVHANSTKGIAIISRFPNSSNRGEKVGTNLIDRVGGGDSGDGLSGPELAEDNKSPMSNRIVHDNLKPVHRVRVTSSKTEAIINNLENLVNSTGQQQPKSSNPGGGGDAAPKSPSPPPLPARPAGGLVSKKALQGAGAKQPQSNPVQAAARPPATRSRSASGSAGGGVVATAVRSLGQQLSQQPEQKQPLLRPVKQPRRSTAPEYNTSGSGSSDDENNEPSTAAAPVITRSKVATRRSLAEVRRVAAAVAGKAPLVATNIQPRRLPGRRSEPLAPSSLLIQQQQQKDSPSTRVLRPRNHSEKDSPVPPELPEKRRVGGGGATSPSSSSSASKRKRRSSQDLAAASGIAAPPGGKRRSCRPLPPAPPMSLAAASPSLRACYLRSANNAAAAMSSSSSSPAAKRGQQTLKEANKRPRFLRSK